LFEKRLTQPPDALDALAVYRPPGLAKQRRHPAIAVPPVLLRQRDDVIGEPLLVIRPARHFAMRRSMLPQNPAYSPLGHRQLAPQLVDASPSPRGA